MKGKDLGRHLDPNDHVMMKFYFQPTQKTAPSETKEDVGEGAATNL